MIKLINITAFLIIILINTCNAMAIDKQYPYFYSSTLNALNIVDTILKNPNDISAIMLNKEISRKYIDSNFLKPMLDIRMCNFIIKNDFKNYIIQEISSEGYNIDSILSQKLYITVKSKKTSKPIIFIFDIVQPEKNWKIIEFWIYQPNEYIKDEKCN